MAPIWGDWGIGWVVGDLRGSALALVGCIMKADNWGMGGRDRIWSSWLD